MAVRDSRLRWIPDLPDQRDFYRVVAPRAVASRGMIAPKRRRQNQGVQGSCTGFAATEATETALLARGVDIDLSPAAAYLYGREALGTVWQDSGCMIRDVVKGIAKRGLPSAATVPYTDRRLLTGMEPDAIAEAARHKATKYERVERSIGVRAALADGSPVLLGFTVYASFMDRAGADGIYPEPTGGVVGGHAVCAIGWDDERVMPWGGTGAVLIANSWGPEWGASVPGVQGRGFFAMPYRVLDDEDLSADFWTITVPPLDRSVTA